MSFSQNMTQAERDRAIRQVGLRGPSFAYENKGGTKKPSFDRVIAGLSDREILDELENERGEVDYQRALRSAAKKRGLI